MKKLFLAAAILFLAGMLGIGDASAHGRGGGYRRVDVGIGVGFGPYWGWGGWSPWYYPPPYYYPYYYPPVVIERPDPPVYIEQPQPAPAVGYWYYCRSPGGYYPNVRECPGGWLKVLPRP